MRGCVRKRYKGSWNVIIDTGYSADPVTGKSRRKQRWLSVKGTKKDAEKALAEALRAINRGEYVEPSKTTFGDWLDDWHTKVVTARKAPGTAATYAGVIKGHLKPALGAIRLQALTPLHLENYYATTKLGAATLQQHHAIVHSALAAALRSGLVTRNVASLVTGKPRARAGHQDVLDNCWTAAEAQTFLQTVKVTGGPMWSAFYSLALDTGMRKGELCGLLWTDVDLAKGCVSVQRQLLKAGAPPTFGPPKNRTPRTIDLSAETVALLTRHKAHQAEVKLANRRVFHDHGLVFSKSWDDLQRHNDVLGDPLPANNLGSRSLDRFIKAAGVRRIKVHGLRHTSATLLLQAGVAPHVVQRRLGHKRIEQTLGTYAHALPAMQQDAAAKLAALLHG